MYNFKHTTATIEYYNEMLSNAAKMPNPEYTKTIAECAINKAISEDAILSEWIGKDVTVAEQTFLKNLSIGKKFRLIKDGKIAREVIIKIGRTEYAVNVDTVLAQINLQD